MTSTTRYDKDEIINEISSHTRHGLSEQQKKCLQQVDSPPFGSKLVRIIAAAGAGKTTTLMKLAECAERLGHKEVTYVTFSKAAAEDISDRITTSMARNHGFILNCSTLHSCAMQLMQKYRMENMMDNGDHHIFIHNDRQLENAIKEILDDKIQQFLASCYHRLDTKYEFDHPKLRRKKRFAHKKVLFFLRKTFTQFCRSELSLEDFGNHKTFNRLYYPLKRYHEKEGKEDGFEGYERKMEWYANVLYENWSNFDDFKSYDLEMKRVQVNNLPMPGTVILLDECQDCDGCQISWIAAQREKHKQIFLVGDAAQTIYSFRGAKSKYMMGLEDAKDLMLTNSWRFGSNIAEIANCVLFAKEMSPQTIRAGGGKLWQPYRVQGNRLRNDLVVFEAIVTQWEDIDVTLIARTNATLFKEAIKLIKSNNNGPKIHINGRGHDSGSNKMREMEKQLKGLYSLFMISSTDSEDGRQRRETLDEKIFPEFDEPITWKEFINEVRERELGKYIAAIGVVEEFGRDTMKELEMFKEIVLEKKYTAGEADIILTTVHAAKGMEWDNVQVFDDFMFQMELKKYDGKWQFKLNNYGDEANLLYVALTRAKKVLSIPSFMAQFLNDCDKLHLMKMKDDYDQSCFGIDCTNDLKSVYSEIVNKIRKENSLDETDYFLFGQSDSDVAIGS